MRWESEWFYDCYHFYPQYPTIDPVDAATLWEMEWTLDIATAAALGFSEMDLTFCGVWDHPEYLGPQWAGTKPLAAKGEAI